MTGRNPLPKSLFLAPGERSAGGELLPRNRKRTPPAQLRRTHDAAGTEVCGVAHADSRVGCVLRPYHGGMTHTDASRSWPMTPTRKGTSR